MFEREREREGGAEERPKTTKELAALGLNEGPDRPARGGARKGVQ